MKKLLLSLGAIAALTAPVVAITSCGTKDKYMSEENQKKVTQLIRTNQNYYSQEAIKILTTLFKEDSSEHMKDKPEDFKIDVDHIYVWGETMELRFTTGFLDSSSATFQMLINKDGLVVKASLDEGKTHAVASIRRLERTNRNLDTILKLGALNVSASLKEALWQVTRLHMNGHESQSKDTLFFGALTKQGSTSRTGTSTGSLTERNKESKNLLIDKIKKDDLTISGSRTGSATVSVGMVSVMTVTGGSSAHPITVDTPNLLANVKAILKAEDNHPTLTGTDCTVIYGAYKMVKYVPVDGYKKSIHKPYIKDLLEDVKKLSYKSELSTANWEVYEINGALSDLKILTKVLNHEGKLEDARINEAYTSVKGTLTTGKSYVYINKLTGSEIITDTNGPLNDKLDATPVKVLGYLGVITEVTGAWKHISTFGYVDSDLQI